MHRFAKLSRTTAKAKTKAEKLNGDQQQLHARPEIPFRAGDRILLVGEGRFLLRCIFAVWAVDISFGDCQWT